MPTCKPQRHEPLDLVLGVALAAHPPRVDLLELVLDPLERARMLVEHPLEQPGEEHRPVEVARPTRARGELGELVEHRRRALVGRHDPVVAHHALDLARLRVGVRPGSRRGDVDVLPPVPEGDAVARVEEPLDALVVQAELLRDLVDVIPRRIVQIDPQQHRAAQASGLVGQGIELLRALTLEEDRAGHEAALDGNMFGSSITLTSQGRAC